MDRVPSRSLLLDQDLGQLQHDLVLRARVDLFSEGNFLVEGWEYQELGLLQKRAGNALKFSARRKVFFPEIHGNGLPEIHGKLFSRNSRKTFFQKFTENFFPEIHGKLFFPEIHGKLFSRNSRKTFFRKFTENGFPEIHGNSFAVAKNSGSAFYLTMTWHRISGCEILIKNLKKFEVKKYSLAGTPKVLGENFGDFY
jgi:hypothetical protein